MNAREAALDCLRRSRRDGAWSGAAIDSAVKKYSLDRRDAALFTRMYLGVLQNSSLLDYYISVFCTTPAEKLESAVLDILRLGAYQIVFLDKVPYSAAVSESVELCKRSSLSRAAGLVNAVLRRIAENADELPDVPGKGTAEYLSVKYSHPLWLAERMVAERGYEFTEGFFAADNAEPPLYIQVNTLKIESKELERAFMINGIDFEKTDVEGCLRLRGGKVTELPGFEEGLFFVQDYAANIASRAAGAAGGMKVLDACSSPGGKSFAMAISMGNKGGILSSDISEKKLALVNSGAQRLGIDIISTTPHDAREHVKDWERAYDIVFADVPCSGLGVIGKKPEIRYKDAESIASLPKIQGDILDNLALYVKPGGTLLYSTCTVLHEENEDVVKSFLSKHDDFYTEDFCFGSVSSKGGMYSFWPHIDHSDGFFAARLKRKTND